MMDKVAEVSRALRLRLRETGWNSVREVDFRS